MRTLIITLIALMSLTATAQQSATCNKPAHKTEQVSNKTETAETGVPVAGKTITSNGKPRQVYRGARGGYYYYTQPQRGKHMGQTVKRYLTKQQKQALGLN